MLSRRDHSEKELQDKLKRWYTPEAVQVALHKAHELTLIKDPEFLQKMFAESLHRRVRGIRTINQVLKKKGLPAAARDEDREIEKCHVLLRKKFKTTKKLDHTERVKAFRHLIYRGFEPEVINKALNTFVGSYE